MQPEIHQQLEDLPKYLEHASIGLHCVNADGIILWANQAELNLMGYSQEEYFGQSITQYHADPTVIDDILTRLSHFETLVNYPARLITKNNVIKYVLINSNVYEIEGKFIHTRCFTHEVSEVVYKMICDEQRNT